MKSNYFLPRIALLFAALLWAGGFIGVQDALNHGWDVSHILAIRGLLGGGLLLGIQWKTHWWRKTYLLRSGGMLGLFLFFGFALQTIGQSMSTPSNSAFITALYIMFVPFIIRLFKKRKIASDVYVAIFLAVIGVAVLSLTASFKLQAGDLLLVLCAVAFALQIVMLEEIALQHEPLALAGVQLVTMGILALFLIPFAPPVLPTGGLGGILFISLFSSCIAFLIQAICQRVVPPSTTSLLLGAESVLGAVLSVLFGYESITWRLVLGGLLFTAAIIICEARPLSRRAEKLRKETHERENSCIE